MEPSGREEEQGDEKGAEPICCQVAEEVPVTVDQGQQRLVTVGVDGLPEALVAAEFAAHEAPSRGQGLLVAPAYHPQQHAGPVSADKGHGPG
ncbi:hypothetical protein GCM10009616_36230 [Microlunatus lacustris]